MKRRRGTDRMIYLDVPIPFRAHGHECYAFVLDGRRIFARWFEGGTVHLAWVRHSTLVVVR